MSEEETIESRKLEKKIKLKSKKSKTTEDSDVVMHAVEDTDGNKGIEHFQASDKDETVECKERRRKGREKKKRKKAESVDDVDLEKNDPIKDELIVLHGEDNTEDPVTNFERKKKTKQEKTKKEKSKKKNGASDSGVLKVEYMGEEREIEHSEKDDILVGRKQKRKKKDEKVKGVEDVDLEKKCKAGSKLIGLHDNDSTEVLITNILRKTKKKNKSKNKNGTGNNTNGDVNNENGKNIIQDGTDANGEDKKNGMSNLVRRNKKKDKTNNENEAANGKDGIGDEIYNAKEKKKRENKNEVGIAEEVVVNEVQESISETKRKKKSKTEKENKKKKKKSEKQNGENEKIENNKKVRFSGEVEVFNLPPKISSTENNKEEDKEKLYRWNNKGDNLIRGKRFTKEEDEIIKDAVLQYIKFHNLGKDGLDLEVLNSRMHKEVRGSWKEIGSSIPYRPCRAVYLRAQVLFRKRDNRRWTQEDIEMIHKYQKSHGNNWKLVAEVMGSHPKHVRHAWRRTMLPNWKKGNWSQQENQKLFDLVNTNLQLKVAESEEKKTRYGLLRDNIAWTTISNQLETRTEAACCIKWYKQLTSPMVAQGVWADADDYRMVGRLYSLDASSIEDVDWDELLEDRPGELCRKRWNQMSLHIGRSGLKDFAQQVEILSQRYCPHLFEIREEWDNKPRVV